MVRGRAIEVTAVALMYQCADTTRIARGRSIDSPNVRHARVNRLSSSAFIGLPWPRNAAGRVLMATTLRPNCGVPSGKRGPEWRGGGRLTHHLRTNGSRGLR